MNSGETRVFPSPEADHSGKTPGFFPWQILKTYGVLTCSFHKTSLTRPWQWKMKV
ncbi:Uncharacterized protein dnm_073630 [Desulfonema magnum]|uniref:Uncharacterized protein n=1 Tax=Desulfonema magnum TaxID=45655 RepID=A0A975BU55_9BACT|nr:Uncharacterized protein dnm_073630 [Desulfonema magnum]